jgi:rare lipoprotein A
MQTSSRTPAAPTAPLAAGESGTRVLASYYGPGFHGRRTASGERFNRHAMTAAHRTHRFGTRLKVTNPENGRSVIVTVNDRGPFTKGLSLDLSEGAAFQIGRRSTGPVVVAVLD